MAIGFRPSGVNRKPIYSASGVKLCYLHTDASGDYLTSLRGRRLNGARWKRLLRDLQAGSGGSACAVIHPEE